MRCVCVCVAGGLSEGNQSRVGLAAFAVFTGDNQNVGGVDSKRDHQISLEKTSHHVCTFTRACLVRITARLRNRTRNLNSITLGKQLGAE